MRIIGLSSAYDRFGASLLSDIGRYLEPFLEPVAPLALKLEVTSCHLTRGAVRPSLDLAAERFATQWARLPLLRYRSKAGKIELAYPSALLAEQALGYGTAVDPQFPVLLDELTSALGEAFASSRSVSRVVDITALAIALEQARQQAPRTSHAIAETLDVIRTAREAAQGERLKTLDYDEVDWSRYPAAVRLLLNDPFYWNSSDDDAPHGNDTGADLLMAFRTWRPRHRQDSPLKFLHDLLVKWGVSEQSGDDPIAGQAVMQAEIALAFAQIKTDGRCDDDVAARALAAIDLRLREVADNALLYDQIHELHGAIIAARVVP